LFWQSLEEVEEDYTVFIHLVSPKSGQVIAQVDEQPQHKGYPTSLWVKGEVVRDEHELTLPELEPGAYELRVGLYVQETGEHLLAGGADEYSLGLVDIRK
jgi:hypothetical protein